MSSNVFMDFLLVMSVVGLTLQFFLVQELKRRQKKEEQQEKERERVRLKRSIYIEQVKGAPLYDSFKKIHRAYLRIKKDKSGDVVGFSEIEKLYLMELLNGDILPEDLPGYQIWSKTPAVYNEKIKIKQKPKLPDI